MKKILLFLLSITFVMTALSGCNFSVPGANSTPESSVEGPAGESSEQEKNVYTVTFKQEGQEDIVKEVEQGKWLTDIPDPVQKTGYTTKWAVDDFKEITENIIVEAISTANEYTITYDAGEGKVDTAEQKVTYDEAPGVFAVPTRENYSFVCWTYEGKAVQATDIWKIASDVTLVANWVEIEKCTVTFVQDGYEPIVIEVLDGGAFDATLIPETQAKVGYTVVWEEKIPSQITENIVINAVATPNTYYITYDAGEGEVDMTQQSVVYDCAPETFALPTRVGYTFKGWEYEGKVLSASEGWTIAKDVTLTAKWEQKTYTIKLNAQGGKLTETTITVVYGESYSLPTPKKTYCEFLGWKYGSTKIALNGIWELDVEEEITLSAEWLDDGWTNNY